MRISDWSSDVCSSDLDHEELGLQIVDQHQQAHAGQPGGVGLPLEPGELVRQPRRRDQVLHHVVEAAAVHLPGLAAGTLRQPGQNGRASSRERVIQTVYITVVADSLKKKRNTKK